MFGRLGIIIGLVVSMIIHYLIFTRFPGPPLSEEIEATEYTEVELVERSLVLPEVQEEIPVLEESKPEPEPAEAPGEEPEEEVVALEPPPAPPEPPDLSEALAKAESVSLGVRPEPTQIKVEIPGAELALPEDVPEEIPAFEPPLAMEAVLERMGESPLLPGEPMGVDIPLRLGSLREEGEDIPELPSAPPSTEGTATDRQAPPSLAWNLEPEGLLTARKRVETPAWFEIRGPASQRTVISRPETPRVDIPYETVVELKFWVLPDGTVGRILPIIKGDTRLEEEAIRYMKQWRFNPLSRRVEQTEQWGTIPIKFTFQ